MYRSILLSAAAIALMAGTISAQACDITAADFQPGAQIRLPHFSPPKSQRSYGSIVGVWQVSYSVNGQVALNTIDTWSGDGNEFLSADKNPILGNVCAGVWQSKGMRGAQLHHLGWTFDGTGTPTGTLVDDESVTLNRRGTGYTGDFDFKFYDTDGNLVKEVTGTSSAARVTTQ